MGEVILGVDFRAGGISVEDRRALALFEYLSADGPRTVGELKAERDRLMAMLPGDTSPSEYSAPTDDCA